MGHEKNDFRCGIIMSGREYLDTLPAWNGTGTLALDSILNVLEHLGNPQDQVPAIHVAGTNGKGSVCANVASILGAAGYRVGLTVSPHLYDLSERIVINGLSISEELLEDAVKTVRDASEACGEQLSFFEFMVAVAFVSFSQLKLDFIVLETGLGGRLDATNVVAKPIVCAITTISYDHQHLLGDSLEAIAAEKAGIIKIGVPVVVGLVSDEVGDVILGVARDRQAKISRLGIEYWYKLGRMGEGVYENIFGKCLEFRTGLHGSYQIHNASVAIDIAEQLGVSDQAIRLGLSNVKWPGRLEGHNIGSNVVTFDACHNEAGILGLVEYIKDSNLANIHVIFGVLRTKNWKEMITQLAPVVSSWSLLEPDVDHAVSCRQVADYLAELSIKCQVFDRDYEKVASMLKSEVLGGHTFVCGSMYMMGKLRSLLDLEISPIWIKY